MEMTSLNRCPLCGSENIRNFRRGTVDPATLSPADFRITDNRYGSLWSFDRCGECCFVFANPVPGAQFIEAFYSRLDDREYGKEAEGRSRNFAVILKRLDALLAPGARMLDVGAASGIFMKLAQDRGYSVAGVEPSRTLVEEARERYGLSLMAGTVDDLEENETYQVITCLDLIEHLTDPLPALRSITQRLEKDGILVIVTPDIRSLAARVTGRHWWHFRTAHINFFSRPSLRVLMESLGLEIVSWRRYAWHFSLFYLVTRLLPSLGRSKTLQRGLKRINCTLHLFDSWEIYARKL